MGDAKITPGFAIVVEAGEDDRLTSCYWDPLNLASPNSLTKMGFPSISFGIYHFLPERVPLITACEVRNHLTGKISIRLVTFDSHMFGILSTCIKQGGRNDSRKRGS